MAFHLLHIFNSQLIHASKINQVYQCRLFKCGEKIDNISSSLLHLKNHYLQFACLCSLIQARMENISLETKEILLRKFNANNFFFFNKICENIVLVYVICIDVSSSAENTELII